jgi:hypothetical protein
VALSVPTPEYFKTFGWSATPVSSSVISPSMAPPHPICVTTSTNVRNGSTFCTAGLKSSHECSTFPATQRRQLCERREDSRLGNSSRYRHRRGTQTSLERRTHLTQG